MAPTSSNSKKQNHETLLALLVVYLQATVFRRFLLEKQQQKISDENQQNKNNCDTSLDGIDLEELESLLKNDEDDENNKEERLALQPSNDSSENSEDTTTLLLSKVDRLREQKTHELRELVQNNQANFRSVLQEQLESGQVGLGDLLQQVQQQQQQPEQVLGSSSSDLSFLWQQPNGKSIITKEESLEELFSRAANQRDEEQGEGLPEVSFEYLLERPESAIETSSPLPSAPQQPQQDQSLIERLSIVVNHQEEGEQSSIEDEEESPITTSPSLQQPDLSLVERLSIAEPDIGSRTVEETESFSQPQQHQQQPDSSLVDRLSIIAEPEILTSQPRNSSQPQNDSSSSSSSSVQPTEDIIMEDERRLRLLEFQTDIEAADNVNLISPDGSTTTTMTRREHQHMAQQILDTIGDLLNQADRELATLDGDDHLLGSALVRGCQELADAVAGLAEKLEQHPERRALAQACLQDFSNNNNSNSELQLHSDKSYESWEDLEANNDHSQTAVPSEDDMMAAVTAAAELLRDVESALRAIEQDEADELADVALTVAHLFVASLQQVHAQLTPEELADHMANPTQQQKLRESPNIELLDDEEEEDGGFTTSTRTARSTTTGSLTKQPDRMRCLWPPIGPSVGKALNWSKDELEKQHWLLTAALGITLWPVAVMTAVVGTPAVLADRVVQNVYEQFQNGPIITAAEVATAQLYQTTRLMLLTGKAVARPTLRVARRQIERHGPGMQEWAVHRVTHPVQTIGETVSGILWLSGQVVTTIQHHVQEWQEKQEEQRTVQEMQL